MSHQLETIIGYKFKNPKLLETFADTTITIERGEIELASQMA